MISEIIFEDFGCFDLILNFTNKIDVTALQEEMFQKLIKN